MYSCGKILNRRIVFVGSKIFIIIIVLLNFGSQTQNAAVDIMGTKLNQMDYGDGMGGTNTVTVGCVVAYIRMWYI